MREKKSPLPLWERARVRGGKHISGVCNSYEIYEIHVILKVRRFK